MDVSSSGVFGGKQRKDSPDGRNAGEKGSRRRAGGEESNPILSALQRAGAAGNRTSAERRWPPPPGPARRQPRFFFFFFLRYSQFSRSFYPQVLTAALRRRHQPRRETLPLKTNQSRSAVTGGRASRQLHGFGAGLPPPPPVPSA